MEKKEREFAQIYEREADAIFRYALVRTGNREEALDITADTFLGFWRTLMKDAIVENARPLLFTIVRSRVIDWYRKKKSLSLDAMTQGDNGEFFEVADPSIHNEIQDKAEAGIILKAVGDLRSEYREVVYLRFVENLSPVEIADILQATPNAVSIRINRGLAELRKILKIENH